MIPRCSSFFLLTMMVSLIDFFELQIDVIIKKKPIRHQYKIESASYHRISGKEKKINKHIKLKIVIIPTRNV